VLSQAIAGQAALAGGAALALAGAAVGLARLDYERVPRVAVLSSAFFVASLVHFKVGPTSVHLTLNGLVGIILGWAAFPAMLIALLLQAIFFGHGGITTLGLNAFNFAFPALVCFFLFNGFIRKAKSKALVLLAGFLAGAISLYCAALFVAAELMAAGGEFRHVMEVVLFAHLPVGLIEGIVTAAAVVFLRRVRPELLNTPA
jgi:cobalt/nickel transport system permease protein